MNRRRLLKGAAASPLLQLLPSQMRGAAKAAGATGTGSSHRTRPSDPAWPSQVDWQRLDREVGGRLIKVQSPLAACDGAPDGAACTAAFKNLKNPYYVGDEAGLTQTSGWVDAWTSKPSAYAVAAGSAADVVAAVKFARDNNLRLVVKGGGHSYQGTSNAPDSLLIWTRAMNGIVLHDAFVADGCAAVQAPQPAVTVEAGAIWMHAYDAVTTKAGRYVQGGGCATVGVAGLVQSGGFGSFSKNYGTAAAGLLEAEIVTADGAILLTNACTNPDLFWAIKGGGGGSFGVVTKLTLRTRDLPEFFGIAFASIGAKSDAAFRRLIGDFIRFYNDSLFNRHWGETVAFRTNNSIQIGMVFQGLDQQQAADVWKPFFDFVAQSPGDFSMPSPPTILALPARRLWDHEFLRKYASGMVLSDDRAGAPAGNIFWSGNLGEAGWFLHGYESTWLPAALLAEDQRQRLADALFASTRHWQMALHFNKGLAGSPEDALTAAKDTATNPAVLDAFALAISAAEGPPAVPGMAGHEPDLALAREHAQRIGKSMGELRRLLPSAGSGAGSYVSESNFFENSWQQAFWGPNYPRLAAVKNKYDPAGLFFVHHGVGSEQWSADGFTRLGSP